MTRHPPVHPSIRGDRGPRHQRRDRRLLDGRFERDPAPRPAPRAPRRLQQPPRPRRPPRTSSPTSTSVADGRCTSCASDRSTPRSRPSSSNPVSAATRASSVTSSTSSADRSAPAPTTAPVPARAPPRRVGRTTDDQVADLRALLAAAKVPPPYLLVGYSLGGWNAIVHADRYPDDVVGAVFAEVRPPAMSQRDGEAAAARRPRRIPRR